MSFGLVHNLQKLAQRLSGGQGFDVGIGVQALHENSLLPACGGEGISEAGSASKGQTLPAGGRMDARKKGAPG